METSLNVYDYPNPPEYEEENEIIEQLKKYINILDMIDCEEELEIYESEIEKATKIIYGKSIKIELDEVEDIIEELRIELGRYN